MSTGPSHARGPGRRDLWFMREMAAGRLPFTVREGGGGSSGSHLVCGFLGCDIRPFNPLLATLPRLLHVRRRRAAGDPLGQLDRLHRSRVAPARGGRGVRAPPSQRADVRRGRAPVSGHAPRRADGLARGLAGPVVGRRWPCCTSGRRSPWTLEQLARTSGCHAPRWRIASLTSWVNRRCSTSRAGGCRWPRVSWPTAWPRSPRGARGRLRLGGGVQPRVQEESPACRPRRGATGTRRG